MWISVSRTVTMSMGPTPVPVILAIDLTIMNSTAMVSMHEVTI